MKKCNVIISVILMNITVCSYSFLYDDAVSLAQHGKWKDAHEKLNMVLIDSPDKADVLYDAGVAAYNLENFSQSAACFLRAAEYADDNDLRIKAHFNAGNALVPDKKLQEALDQYQKVLDIEPHHEPAQYNYDRVKQMVDDQQKKEQNDKQNQQDKQDKQDNKDQQDQQDSDQSDNDDKQDEQEDNQQNQNDKDDQSCDNNNADKNGNNSKQKNNNKNNQNKNNDQSKNDSNNDSSEKDLDKKTESEQENKAQSGRQDAERKEQRNNKNKQEQRGKNHERNSNEELEKKPQDKENKAQVKSGDQHQKTPEETMNDSDNASVTSQGNQDQGESAPQSVANVLQGLQQNFEEKINDPWLLNVLKQQEESDKMVNKQLMEAKIHQHGGKYGQNCW